MFFSQECLFNKEHIWLKEKYNICTIGITDLFQSILGNAIYLELPTVKSSFIQGDIIATLSTVRVTHKICMPVTGIIADTNERIRTNPGLINIDPFGEGWIMKIEIFDKSQLDVLMKAKEYEIYVYKQIKINQKYIVREY